jgi:FtsH-binding integral membrane protein
MLFIDFVNIFRYILILLKEKNDKDSRKSRR